MNFKDHTGQHKGCKDCLIYLSEKMDACNNQLIANLEAQVKAYKRVVELKNEQIASLLKVQERADLLIRSQSLLIEMQENRRLSSFFDRE
jgi:hypothetical protein